jgi:hypothetical protein
MANLPRAVQRQIEQADAIVAELNKPAEPAPQAQPPADPPAQDTQQVQPPVEANEPPAEPPAPPAPPSVDWEHKFKTLQGLFNAEVPKLQQRTKQLEAQLQEVVAKQNEPKKDAPAEPPKAATHDKDVEEFGGDLVEMVHRQVSAQLGAISSKLDSLVQPLTDRLLQLERAVEGTSSTVSATAEEMFFDRLSKSVPDWETLNIDQKFIDWLAEVDPVYGQPRHAALAAARQALDSTRVTAVFNAYKKTLAPAPKTDPLSKQVSPKSGASSAPPQAPQKQLITEKSIQDFYHQVATGKYRGRESEVAEIETLINLAIAEGRVV